MRHRVVVPLRGTTPQLELWAAGNDQLASFAVCGHGGRPLWYSRLSADHGLHPAWKAVPAQTVAATKAIWLAGQTRGVGRTKVRLLLHLSDPEVDGEALADVAAKAGVSYRTDVVWGSPAVEWCNQCGSAEWREHDLSNLASHRSPHAPFYRGRLAAAAVTLLAAAAVIGTVLGTHGGGSGGSGGSATASASAIMADLPAPLRAAASTCAPASTDGGTQENCAINGDDPMVKGLLTPGRDREKFSALIEPAPSKTVAQWRRHGDTVTVDGTTAVRIEDHAPGGVGVESLDTASGLDVQLSGFANPQDAADFVRRAGW